MDPGYKLIGILDYAVEILLKFTADHCCDKKTHVSEFVGRVECRSAD